MMRRKFSRITGPLLSILIHLGVVVLLALFLGQFVEPLDEPGPEDTEFTFIDRDQIDIEIDPKTDPDIDFMDDPTADIPVIAPVTPPIDPIKDVPVQPDQQTPRWDLPSVVTLPPTTTLTLPPGIGPRVGHAKTDALNRHAEKHARVSKIAVLRALEWLHKNQEADGRWESNNGDSELATTGLATLAFLANGYTPSDKRYGPTIEKALKYMISKQDKNGLWGREYSHAICTYAMAEALALTRIPTLRESLKNAVPHITNGMNVRDVARVGSMQPVRGLDPVRDRRVSAGLWDYKYKTDTGRFDSSVSGWQVQALKAAKLAGMQSPMIDRSLALSSNGMKHMQSEKSGKIGYTTPGAGSDWMTGVGALSLMMTGNYDSPEVQQALEHLGPATCLFAEAKPSAFYGWYYLTQVKFNQQGAPWKSWRNQFVREYTRHQEKDGSWISPSGGEGHGNENTIGRAYTTSLGVLTMSVFYRSELLTNQDGAIEIATPVSPDEDEFQFHL